MVIGLKEKSSIKSLGIIRESNLEAKRDFTDVRDMVRGYWFALDKGEPGEVYNICSERAIQIKGLLNHLNFILNFIIDSIQNKNIIRN